MSTKRTFAVAGLMLGLAVVVVIFNLTGCTDTVPRAELTAQREGMVQVDQPIVDEHKEWTQALATEDGKQSLSVLTPAQVNNRLRLHQEREDFIESRRAADKKFQEQKDAPKLLNEQPVPAPAKAATTGPSGPSSIRRSPSSSPS